MDENVPPPMNAPTWPPPPAAATPPPPLHPPPPLIIPPTSTPPSRRGRGWMVLALVLLVLLGVSFLYNLGNFANRVFRGGRTSRLSARTSGPRLDEVITEDNDAIDKIAVIDVAGVITSRNLDQGNYNMVDLIKAQLKSAKEDDKVKAVILKVDSPGGEVLASDEINRLLSDFQTNGTKAKPIIASMGSLAASGGYYVSVPCRWIVANELTITGSIGVILSTYNYRGLMDKVGLVPETFKSGKYKDMLSGSREPDKITDEERAMVQRLIDETYGRFKQVVQDGRDQAYDKNKSAKGADKGRQLDENWKDYADGRVLSGSEALEHGFVDELGNFDVAVKRTKLLAGISSANLIEYQQRFDLSDVFRMFGQTDSKVVKVDIGMDAPKLQAGQLYFLAPTFLH
jgi:protease-4